MQHSFGVSIKVILAIIACVALGYVAVRLAPQQEQLSSPQSPEQTQIPQEPHATAVYVCDEGKTITAAFFEKRENATTSSEDNGGVVELTFTDPSGTARTLTLPQGMAADGARFVTPDESFVFWTKGNGAKVLENGNEMQYVGCIVAAPLLEGSPLIRVFASSSLGFTLRLPSFTVSTTSESLDAYRVNGSYQYRSLGPDKRIPGVKFTIPTNIATGTNLSLDSFLSVEQLSVGTSTGTTTTCSAELFLPKGVTASPLVEGGVTYSFASSSDAAAGNRYEELVYAFPDTNPCRAMRYFIHYTAFENYPKNSIKEFDRSRLIDLFDQIRKTLVIDR